MIKLLNLPWTFNNQELARFISRTLNTRVRRARVLYDRQTGLSRGIGLVQLESDRVANDATKRGTLTAEGRTVRVVRNNDQQE